MRSLNIHRAPLALLPLLAAGGGCEPPPEPGAASFRVLDDDGPERWGTWPPPGGTLNTAWLGDIPLMRLMLPGQPGHNTRTGDVFITRIEILDRGRYHEATSVSVSAERGDLMVAVDDAVFRGPDLVGSRWWLSAPGRGSIEITDFSEHEHQFGYELTHHPTSDIHGEEALCRPDVEGGRWAYVVGDVDVDPSGTLSPGPGGLLIACASGALGKAITWGFSPWDEAQGLQLDLYQTGVRTVLADYCGTGQSYTEDGTQIQVSNARAGQSFSDLEAATEAVFGPDGALCLSDPRITAPRIDGSRDGCSLPRCGDDASVAVIMDDPSRAWTKHAPLFGLP